MSMYDQKPLQYCKVIGLQLIKINEGEKKNVLSSPWSPQAWVAPVLPHPADLALILLPIVCVSRSVLSNSL